MVSTSYYGRYFVQISKRKRVDSMTETNEWMSEDFLFSEGGFAAPQAAKPPTCALTGRLLLSLFYFILCIA